MTADIDQLLHTLTHVVNTLQDKGIRFAVGGGCAVYARGGPESEHDVDIFVRPQDSAAARTALVAVGMRPEDPVENWLTKVYDGDILVDLIFRTNHHTVDDALLDRAETMGIGPASAPVLTGTDLLIDRLMVLDAHRLDFTRLLATARALREQIDWPAVHREVSHSPYARAFLGLTADLGLHPFPFANARGEPPQYVVANLRRAFAEDPRTATSSVRVTLRGDVIVLTGEVSDESSRGALETVLRERVGQYRVHNDVRVSHPAAPAEPERLR
ncbi:nucleotidyltransferase [Nocardia neocaledoniensis]|uniref:Putative nucleotidyltransferase-like protein n=1 Tax=Nocardia neocaledoniensis TaxID=236511 RepID=A0A317N8X4_9NOCA|nr:nucleotidyltransferase [Nocardia neocaledoniensis]PWV71721.1 putative nucleotidyltransferase-like protein [Nocardia neocaledoniensis]